MGVTKSLPLLLRLRSRKLKQNLLYPFNSILFFHLHIKPSAHRRPSSVAVRLRPAPVVRFRPALPRKAKKKKKKKALYEIRSNFYMIGIPTELNIFEDAAAYTETECSEILRRIHEGNRPTGGLKFITTCYGIVGFIKFLGPYYMLLITKRRQIGVISGHNVYSISKSEIIPLPNSAVRSSMTINYRDDQICVYANEEYKHLFL